MNLGSLVPELTHYAALVEGKKTDHGLKLLREEILLTVTAQVSCWSPECHAA